MKKIFLFLSVSFFACSLQAQDIFKKHGFDKETLTLSKGRYEEVFTNQEVVQIGSVLLNTKTNKVVKFLTEETEDTSFKAEYSSRFLTPDPLAEKYPWQSPYAFCMNNPVRFIDPNGMDVYRYDDKTGNLVLAVPTDDNFDQIGKFKYNKQSGEYELKTNKKGEAKTRIDNIEKGILSDGMNFKTNDNVINVGGEGQATVGGFESFITQFSDMVNKEIGGFYLSDKGSNDVNYIQIGKYKNNSDTKAFSTLGDFYRQRPDLIGNIDVHTDYHTHLSRFPESAKLVPSGLSLPGGDISYKRGQSANGIKRFIILTTGYPPIPY